MLLNFCSTESERFLKIGVNSYKYRQGVNTLSVIPAYSLVEVDGVGRDLRFAAALRDRLSTPTLVEPQATIRQSTGESSHDAVEEILAGWVGRVGCQMRSPKKNQPALKY